MVDDIRHVDCATRKFFSRKLCGPRDASKQIQQKEDLQTPYFYLFSKSPQDDVEDATGGKPSLLLC
jgi:hypothetical protein